MKKLLFPVLLIFFSITLLISVGFLANYFIQSQKQQNQYAELSQLVEQTQQEIIPTKDNPDVCPDIPAETLPNHTEVSAHIQVAHPETGKMVTVLRKYALIFQRNPDLVGWIKIQDTQLNYPVMQTPDTQDYYLRRNFYKESSSHGCIYAREICSITKPSDNITIYGHNMKDGSMFATLHAYADRSFWMAHPTVIFDTLTEEHTYQILSVFQTTASLGYGFPYHHFVDAESAEDFDRFVAACKALSFYDTGVDAVYGDKLITLSTCDSALENGRLVLVAKRIT